MDEESLHVPARDFDEVAAHAVPDSARAAVQHEPDVFPFIQANFDEVIAGAERAEMIRVIASIELWMLFENSVVARLERLPDFIVAQRNLPPSARISDAPVNVRHGRNPLEDKGKLRDV